MDLALSWARVQALAEQHLVPFALKIVVALMIFVGGRTVARMIARAVSGVMERSRMDVSLRKFLGDVLYAILLVAVVTAALDSLGVRTTAVVAVLGAAGLAVGLALQGSLSNFAAGVMIIVLRHYKVGDSVVIGKYTGRVDAIKVFHTVLHTADNREVIIPNAQIIAQPIENMTVLGRRRIDLKVTVAKGGDLIAVKQAVEAVALSDQRIQSSPRPELELVEVTADTMVLMMRPWTISDDVAAVSHDLIERVRDTLDATDVKYTAALITA